MQLSEDELTFLSMSDSYSRRYHLAFIKELRLQFKKAFTMEKIREAKAFSLSEFNFKIKRLLVEYNERQFDKEELVYQTTTENEVKKLPVTNLNKFLEEENLESLREIPQLSIRSQSIDSLKKHTKHKQLQPGESFCQRWGRYILIVIFILCLCIVGIVLALTLGTESD